MAISPEGIDKMWNMLYSEMPGNTVSGRTGSFLQLSPEKGGSCNITYGMPAMPPKKQSPPAPFAVNNGPVRPRIRRLLRSLARRHRPLLFALLLGLSVFAVSYNLLAYIRTEKVVVAARYLEPYRQISVSDIKVVELPRKGIHPDSIRKPEELIGNYTVCPLFAGQPLAEPRHVFPQPARDISGFPGRQGHIRTLPTPLVR